MKNKILLGSVLLLASCTALAAGPAPSAPAGGSVGGTTGSTSNTPTYGGSVGGYAAPAKPGNTIVYGTPARSETVEERREMRRGIASPNTGNPAYRTRTNAGLEPSPNQ